MCFPWSSCCGEGKWLKMFRLDHCGPRRNHQLSKCDEAWIPVREATNQRNWVFHKLATLEFMLFLFWGPSWAKRAARLQVLTIWHRMVLKTLSVNTARSLITKIQKHYTVSTGFQHSKPLLAYILAYQMLSDCQLILLTGHVCLTSRPYKWPPWPSMCWVINGGCGPASFSACHVTSCDHFRNRWYVKWPFNQIRFYRFIFFSIYKREIWCWIGWCFFAYGYRML